MAKKDNEPPKYPEIGARLSQFVEQSGETSARQFAIKAGLTASLLSNLMLGYSMPGGETLAALATTYKDFDATWLLTGKPTRSATQSNVPAEPEGEAKMPPTVKRKFETPMAVVRDVESMTKDEQIAYHKAFAEMLEEELAAIKQSQRHEEVVRLVKSAGGRSFTNASADAADTEDTRPEMVAHTNHEYVERVAEADRLRIAGFVFGGR